MVAVGVTVPERQTLTYATGVVRRHRKKIGSKGRALPPGLQCVRSMRLCRLY